MRIDFILLIRIKEILEMQKRVLSFIHQHNLTDDETIRYIDLVSKCDKKAVWRVS